MKSFSINLTIPFKELKDLGYRGSDVTIRRVTGAWREPVAQLVSVPPAKLPTPRSLSWLLLSRREKLEQGEPEHVKRLLEGSEEVFS